MADQPAAAKKPLTKSELLQSLSESTGLTKQQVTQFIDELAKLIEQSLSTDGAGTFTLPGLMKINARVKPALPERQGRRPGSSEIITLPARPESRTVKVTALKGLKDMVK
jgi:nucleoid DNA-binding protein